MMCWERRWGQVQVLLLLLLLLLPLLLLLLLLPRTDAWLRSRCVA